MHKLRVCLVLAHAAYTYKHVMYVHTVRAYFFFFFGTAKAVFAKALARGMAIPGRLTAGSPRRRRRLFINCAAVYSRARTCTCVLPSTSQVPSQRLDGGRRCAKAWRVHGHGCTGTGARARVHGRSPSGSRPDPDPDVAGPVPGEQLRQFHVRVRPFPHGGCLAQAYQDVAGASCRALFQAPIWPPRPSRRGCRERESSNTRNQQDHSSSTNPQASDAPVEGRQ